MCPLSLEDLKQARTTAQETYDAERAEIKSKERQAFLESVVVLDAKLAALFKNKKTAEIEKMILETAAKGFSTCTLENMPSRSEAESIVKSLMYGNRDSLFRTRDHSSCEFLSVKDAQMPELTKFAKRVAKINPEFKVALEHHTISYGSDTDPDHRYSLVITLPKLD